MTDAATGQQLVLRREAVGRGWSDDELAALVRRRDWARLRRGAYLAGTLPESAATRHLLLVTATLAALRRPAVVSHQSAAVLLGLPLWGARLDRVHMTRRPPAWNDSSRLLVAHVARLRNDEVTAVNGIEVTTPARTALDLARSLPFEAAVVVLDAALHQGVVTPDDLTGGLSDIAGTRGSRAAARAVRLSDGRSESVGESRSRVVLDRVQLPPSSLQFEVLAADGHVVARTDFAWEAQQVVGEFDGKVKYGRLLRPGQEPGDAVFAEKRREDAVRDEGWSVVRWTWTDLLRPDQLATRLQRAMARSTR